MNNELNILGSEVFECSNIGAGGFGTIFKCEMKCDPNIKIAVKRVSGTCSDPKNLNEIEILKRFDNSRIVKYYGSYSDSEHCYILTNYIDGVNLYEVENKFTEDQTKNIIKQLIEIVKIIHDKNVIHRDIKLENILLTKTGEIVLIDFGSAADISNGPTTGLVGTCDYFSPEMVTGKTYGKDVDVWQIGVVAYELLVGHPPFNDPNIEGTKYRIKTSQYSSLRFVPISEDAKDFIRSILRRQDKRATIDDLLESSWLKDV